MRYPHVRSHKNSAGLRDPLAKWLAGLSRSALVMATAWGGASAWGVDLVYDLPQDIVIASDDPALDSVLVGKREGAPLDAAEATELEPISEVSPYEPELADPPEENTPPTVSKLGAGVVMATDERVAALPADGARVLKEAASSTSKRGPSPAKFHGVTPGETTKARLIEQWGEPDGVSAAKGETSGGEVLSYKLAPFEQVEMLIEKGTVAVIRVTLGQDGPVAEMVERLGLTKIEPVEINDPASGGLLAVAYPEKGLTLLTRPAKDLASAAATHLVLEPIDARAFILRCEQRDPRNLSGRLRDLQKAIDAAAGDAHAHWLKASEHLSAGQAAAAEEAAREASRLEPTSAAYRLTLAEALCGAADYDAAVLETRAVLDDTTAPTVVRAGALDLMGRLAAMGDKKIASKTIDFHNAAIAEADKLATSEDQQERRLAKDLLLSSHLAVAKEIARRDYADKVATVAEWIGRASGIAEERIESDGGGLELRLEVAREALAALAQLRPTKDPAPWVKEAEETAAALLAESEDPLFRARVHWELGEAYQHAVRVEHLRGDAKQALAYGGKAIDELSEGAAPRTTSPAAERVVGQLYFYLGAVNAVHKQDHTEAVGWYDKGRDILTAEQPKSEFVVPRRDGEELVSMGVSYWNQDQKDLAIELTEQGARIMERAAKAGVIDGAELAVPYGNLATMYKKLDNSKKALEYGRLVKDIQPAATPTATAPAKTTTGVAKPIDQAASKRVPSAAEQPQASAAPRRQPQPRQDATPAPTRRVVKRDKGPSAPRAMR